MPVPPEVSNVSISKLVEPESDWLPDSMVKRASTVTVSTPPFAPCHVHVTLTEPSEPVSIGSPVTSLPPTKICNASDFESKSIPQFESSKTEK